MYRLSFDRITLFLVFVSCICSSLLYGQAFAVNYTSKDGLDNENITAIAEDQNGYIYVGSATGVMKFDGVEFISFANKGTGHVPENVFVYNLIFDGKNNLWVSTELNGIFHWNRGENHWTNFSYTSEQKLKIQSNEVIGISVIDSFLYFSCLGHGLNSININNLNLRTSLDNSKNSYSDIDTFDDAFLLNGPSVLYSFKAGILSSVASSTKYSLVDTEVYKDKIFVTKYESGLFSAVNGETISLGLEKFADPWRTKIIGILDDEIIITARNSGLLKYQISSQKWRLISAKPYDTNSLIKAKYNGGLIDSRGIIWVATTKGISCFNPKLQGFKNIDNAEGNNDFLIDVLYHEKSGNYIASYASNAEKVKVFDENLIFKNSYNHTPNVSSIRSLHDLMEFNDDIFAVSNGLLKIDPLTGKCTVPKDQFLKSLSNIKTANIDNNGYLWCIYDQDQLIVYNLNTKKLMVEKKLPFITDSSKRRYIIHNIYFDDNYAFIAVENLFFTISKADFKIQAFAIENGKLKPANAHPTNDSKINKVFSFKNFIYITSRNGGIFKTHFKKSDSFQVINYLSTHDLYSPTDFDFDDLGNIWVTTDNGLALLDNNLQIIAKFNSQNGLSNSKLTTGLFIENNRIFLNGENGIIIGDPYLLSLKSSPENVDIPKFEVNGEGCNTLTDKLIFPYTRNNINVKLSMPVYGNNSAYHYQYRLLGSNDKWKFSSIDKNEINYENLNPGSYTFEVKSVVGNNESQITKIEFEIQPPYWKTGYFIFFVIAIISILLALIYKNRIKKKIEKERINTLLSQLENTAIRSQLNPHFIFNSLNSIRSMILLDRKNDSIQYLEQFSDMVREVLQMSKEDKVSLGHEISFNKNYLEIEKLRFSNKFKYYFNVGKELDVEKIKVPPLIIQPFVENAIWHGLLHNEKESILNIDVSSKNESLHIIIDDNGIGRAKSKLLQQSSIKKTKRNLGVSLSRKRISMLGKNATVKIIDKKDNNKNPMGTTVHITIPLKYEK